MQKSCILFLVLIVSTLSLVLPSASNAQVEVNSETPTTRPLPPVDVVKGPIHSEQAPVDVAILLDTSNSMDGLIKQAKSQLWTIIQQFAKAQKYCHTPLLRVALFEYGNTNLPASEGYLRQVVPLSNDLDVLSESLFALTTRGGDEYCGQVIDEAISRLVWSTRLGSYKVIFIAGNEPFTQGSVPYRTSCQRAVDQGIIVNTIHCGDYDEGVLGEWQRGAQAGRGESFNIDQDQDVVYIPCPQDTTIMRLNKALNETYLWYGSAKKREYYASNQLVQDKNANLLSSSIAVSRSVTKSTEIYDNRSRDLVDGLIDSEDILKKVPESELPNVMQEMKPEERIAYLHAMAAKRGELKNQINDLAVEREKYLSVERSRMSDESKKETLGDAIVTAVRKQLVEAGFEISDAVY